jgi:NAD+ synthase (glutamine-hydrolysing)
MQDGFIRVAAATPEVTVADCRYNAEAVCAILRQAAECGVNLIVFPELCLTGYTAGDLFAQDTLRLGALEALAQVLAESEALGSLIAVVGLPFRLEGKLYNCAAVLQSGKILGLVPKTWLPNYAEFYEKRWFEPAPERGREVKILGQQTYWGQKQIFAAETLPDFTFAVEICEDLWAPEPPSINLTRAGAALICNLSAGDELTGKSEYRRNLVVGQSARLLCAYVYAAAGVGESTTDMVFAGHNLLAENGRLLAEAPLFANGMITADVDVSLLMGERQRNTTFNAKGGEERRVFFPLESVASKTLLRPLARTPFVPTANEARDKRCREILNLQAQGLATRMRRVGLKHMLVGLSGGLDSTLALLVMCAATALLGRERADLIAVTMPCFGTSARTEDNANRLATCAGVTFLTVDIKESVRRHLWDIGHPPDVFDIAYENAQARERTQVLMDLANARGGLVVGTGDLSELALGWCTYNGDHMSMYAVNASVPKTLVRFLVESEAERYRLSGETELADVLADICATPISPELLPATGGEMQMTEQVVGPYILNDFFLYYVVRFGFRPRKILRLAGQAFPDFSSEELAQGLRCFYERFFSQQFKRSCLPDGPKVGTVTLSPRSDWRMPSDATAKLWLEETEEYMRR